MQWNKVLQEYDREPPSGRLSFPPVARARDASSVVTDPATDPQWRPVTENLQESALPRLPNNADAFAGPSVHVDGSLGLVCAGNPSVQNGYRFHHSTHRWGRS